MRFYNSTATPHAPGWQPQFLLVTCLLLALHLAGLLLYSPAELCATAGVDFRGYYASAQIARQYGFEKVYDQELQNAAQDALPLRCPGLPGRPPGLHVSMPYLPVFVLLFLPLTTLEFTTSYAVYSLLTLALLAGYLLRFAQAFERRLEQETPNEGQSPTIIYAQPRPASTNLLRLLAWMVCLPVLSNLVLGQSNLWLVVCLGEFILALRGGKPGRSGLWLAGMLIKPYTLPLLLVGLALGRCWRALAGFAGGAALVLGGSLLVGGLDGVAASLMLALRFAGPLITTAPAMMNWRALALNLQALLGGGALAAWAAWLLAGAGMLATVLAVLRAWWVQGRRPTLPPLDFLLLILATLCATFALSWHSHFYLLLLLLPLLVVLEVQGRLPRSALAVWVFGPPALYLAAALVFDQQAARNVLGLGYLGMNIGLVWWGLLWSKRYPSVRSQNRTAPTGPAHP